MNHAAGAVSSLDEIRTLIGSLPGADLAAGAAAAARERVLTKPEGSLGRLEDLARWMAEWQGRHPPAIRHPRTAVFAGNHGVAARGVSAYPPEVTGQMVANFVAGGAAVNQMCRLFDADLRVYELGLESPTADFVENPAMSEQECVTAIAYGMTAVEPGIDLICLGEMGIGNTTSAAALCLALHGGTAADWTGAGTGVAGETLRRKVEIVAQAVGRHRDRAGDPLGILAALGGLELAAIAGAVLAARMARVPVLLDGFACTAAAAVLHAVSPHAIDHCQVAHCSVEPGHRRLLGRIDRKPLLDLAMRLGEGSGATLALGLLQAAAACHQDMATFAEAGVSELD